MLLFATTRFLFLLLPALAAAQQSCSLTLQVVHLFWTWQNPQGGHSVRIDGGNINWGTGLTSAGPSGMRADTETVGFPITLNPGNEAKLGRLTHINYPTDGAIHAVELKVSMIARFDGVNHLISFTYDMRVDETPNRSGTCQFPSLTPCVDQILIINDPHPQSIMTMDGKKFEIDLVGFRTFPQSPTTMEFISQENSQNSAFLYGSLQLIQCPPTPNPTNRPTPRPTPRPTLRPTPKPSPSPTPLPTPPLTPNPTSSPTSSPSMSPTSGPTHSPSGSPSVSPSASPSKIPSASPSTSPSDSPSFHPTQGPTASASESPSVSPSFPPSATPSQPPSASPTACPTSVPTVNPSGSPTTSPTEPPTLVPTVMSGHPSASPTTGSPTSSPSHVPSFNPSSHPTSHPTTSPSGSPSGGPSTSPSTLPSTAPTGSPTASPSGSPSVSPSTFPSTSPSGHPTSGPTPSPSGSPSDGPSSSPSGSPSEQPSDAPTPRPTANPSGAPTTSPTGPPTLVPTVMSGHPSASPTTGSTMPPAGVKGDPHFLTWAGKMYDYMGACDLVLVHAPHFAKNAMLDIHIRTKTRYDYSYIETAVIRIGDEILEVGSYGEFFLNAVDGAMTPNHHYVGHLSGFRITRTVRDVNSVRFEVQIEGKEQIVVKTFKDWVSIVIESADMKRFVGSYGMMGEFGTGTLFGRDGKTIVGDPILLGAEWQVRDFEPMLFQSINGPQYPELCQPPKLDAAKSHWLGAADVSIEDARKACAEWDNASKNGCIHDVLVTGDLDFAAAAARAS